MAEVLLLLLFLLLLALAARIVSLTGKRSQAREIAKAEDTIRP